jgi:hypothetical protein
MTFWSDFEERQYYYRKFLATFIKNSITLCQYTNNLQIRGEKLRLRDAQEDTFMHELVGEYLECKYLREKLR